MKIEDLKFEGGTRKTLPDGGKQGVCRKMGTSCSFRTGWHLLCPTRRLQPADIVGSVLYTGFFCIVGFSFQSKVGKVSIPNLSGDVKTYSILRLSVLLGMLTALVSGMDAWTNVFKSVGRGEQADPSSLMKLAGIENATEPEQLDPQLKAELGQQSVQDRSLAERSCWP